MKTPTKIAYPLAKSILRADFDMWPSRFLTPDGFLNATLIAEHLIDGYDADEDDAYQWALDWIDEPENKLHKDPFYTMTTELEQPIQQAVVVAETAIQFPIADTQIEKFRADYMALKIADIDDKEGAKLVHEARMTLVRARTSVDKARKKLNEDALDHQRRVNDEAKRITALLLPIETHLEKQEVRYEAERERIRQEKALAESKRIEQRVATLRAMDFVYYPQAEHFLQYDGLPLTWEDVKTLAEDEFQIILQEGMTAYNTEQQRLAKAEADRQAEAARLEKQRQQQEAERLRIEAERKTIEAERLELQRQRDENIRSQRANILKAIGCQIEPFGDSDVYHLDTNTQVNHSRLHLFSDEAFSEMVEQSKEAKRQKEEEFRRSLEQLDVLHHLDLKSLYESESSYFYEDVRISKNELGKLGDDWFADQLNRLKEAKENRQKAIDEAAKLQAQQRQQAETEKARKEAAKAERKARLAPDREKLQGLSFDLVSIKIPVLKSEEGKAAIVQIEVELGRLVKWIDELAEKL